MKKKLIIALAIVVAVGGVFALVKSRQHGKAQNPDVIASGRVTRGDIRLTVEGWGTLSAGEVKEVAPLTEGLVDRVVVKEGQQVEAGDPLLTLYNATLGMEVEKARLELEQARLELAKILGVSPEQVDRADPDLALSVRAPVAGRVVELKVKEGEQIGAKQDLLRLVDDSQVLVDLFLDEGSANSIRAGQKAELFFHDFSGSTPGTVKEVDPNRYPDASSFSRRIVIAVPNPGLLAPEMKAGVNIDTGAGIVAGTGTATGWKEDTWVSSGVSGRIDRLQVKEGSRVKPGHIIASLEKSSALLDVYGQILALRQAQVSFERKQEELDGLTLKAPMSGQVIALNTEDGQKVEAGRSVVKIASYEKMNTEITIDELDIVHIRPDMEATVTVDALPGKIFAAQVVEVAREGGSQSANQYDGYSGPSGFPVKVEILEPGDLRAGMTANVSIFIEERKDVLAVPIEAVYEKEGASFVQVIEGGKPKEAEVQLGLQDRALAEVLAGLTEGQEVVTGSSADDELFFGGGGARPVRRVRM
ncbi:MAG TPA: efflux RND transporter periplasmic adaptor subunit [Firmicutes bacterium]|jgi:HlyD family secretion protein|nr:efflux RND transporter periplasmic adaptor subunit [Bacillota bacterium]